jgi:transposase, IS30 family
VTDAVKSPNRRPISDRLRYITDRKPVGHKESDTVIGAAHKQEIVTLVERMCGFAVLGKVSSKSAKLVARAIEAKLKLLNYRVKTLTVDNAKEFADHLVIDQSLGIQTYFADPYCSLQRDNNDSINGLLRQYISKKRNKETVTDKELTVI